MRQYLACLRPINLLIICLTQCLLYHFYFTELDGSLVWTLRPPLIYLFSFITLLIAASGYLINDYFDFDSDLANAKKNRLTDRYAILGYYVVLVVVGFLLSLWFAISLNKPLLSIIYIVAILLLFVYSASWKKKVLIGNVIVALFSSFVMLILIYSERENLPQLKESDHSFIMNNTLAFAVFAFLISMVREIVKDIEDVKGDKAVGYATLPVKVGVSKAGRVAAFVSFLLLTTLIAWLWSDDSSHTLLLLYGIFFLVLPCLYLSYRLAFTSNYSPAIISKLCKGVMLSGLIFIILIGWIHTN